MIQHLGFEFARVLRRLSTVSAVGLLAVSAAFGNQWVVEDVIDPPTWMPGVSSHWTSCWPQPGLDPDGRGMFAVAQDDTGISSASLALRYQQDDPPASRLVRSIGQGAYYNLAESLMLRVPGGHRLVANDPAAQYQHLVLDLPGRTVAGTITQFTVPGAGLLTPALVFPAVDTNGDGFDDFFVSYFGPGAGTGHVAATALIDGATLQRVWATWESGYGTGAFHFLSGPAPDIDGDGLADHVMEVGWVNPASLSLEVKYIALSGHDGTELWRRVAPGVPRGVARFVPDVTMDGVPDVLVGRSDLALGTDICQVLDGTIGSPVWSTPVSVASPHFTAGPLLAVRLSGVTVVGCDPGSGIEETVPLVYADYANGDVEWAYLHLDAADGVARRISGDPSNLEPWFLDPLRTSGALGTDHFPLGDIDRDGLEENAALAEAVGWPTNGFQESRRLVIIGQETLDCPDQVQLGGTMQLDVGIPSAGGMECVLIASTAFDGGGGLVLDGWKTNLAAGDPVLQSTLQTRAYSTTLDNLGRGSFTVAVPPIPQLAGQTLYLRAVALEPGTTSEVWTLSTLGIVEIL